MGATERAAVLRRIAQGIRDHAEEFIAREVADIGMPISQMKGLAARAAQNFDYYAAVCPSCTAGRSRSATSSSTTRFASRSVLRG